MGSKMVAKVHRDASEIHLEINKGTDLEFTLIWREGAGNAADNSPSHQPPIVDSSAMTAELIVRPLVQPKAEPANANDIVIPATTSATGEIVTTFTDTLTAGFTWEKAEYNLFVTEANSNVRLLAYGNIKAYNTLKA